MNIHVDDDIERPYVIGVSVYRPRTFFMRHVLESCVPSMNMQTFFRGRTAEEH